MHISFAGFKKALKAGVLVIGLTKGMFKIAIDATKKPAKKVTVKKSAKKATTKKSAKKATAQKTPTKSPAARAKTPSLVKMTGHIVDIMSTLDILRTYWGHTEDILRTYLNHWSKKTY